MVPVTTAGVAHKMDRKYIGIEMGEHAYTHRKPRLDKMIAGSEQGGISRRWSGERVGRIQVLN